MIRYALRCANGHGFDSWFQSSDAFDRLAAGGMVTCEACGSADVAKAVMAPRVGRNGAAPAPAAAAAENPAPPAAEKAPLSTPSTPAEAALRALRAQIEKNSDYVGRDFAAEARRIHQGEAESRQIHGEASREEARALVEDGVPVLPIPPLRKIDG